MHNTINAPGHRIGTDEINSSLVAHGVLAQALVFGYPHVIKGKSKCWFYTLSARHDEDKEFIKNLIIVARTSSGIFAVPGVI